MITETTERDTNAELGQSALKRLVMRFTVLRMMFYRDFQPGQKYVFIDHADNPFKRDKFIVEIKAVKGKWINYKHVGSSMFNDESMKRDLFNFCYVRYDA